MSPPDVRRRRGARSAEDLLRAAALFRALAEGLSYPEPGHRDAFNAQLLALASPSGALQKRLARLRRTWNTAADDALRAEWSRLFVGSGACSLHETAYGDARRIAGRAVELADVSGFYAAFGIAVSNSDPDLPDHVCAELEFHSLLLVKLAYAVSRRKFAERQVTRAAARSFLEQHLGRWVGALGQAVAELAPSPPYASLLDALRAAVTAECRAFGAHPAPFSDHVPFDTMQEESFSCPRAGTAAETSAH